MDNFTLAVVLGDVFVLLVFVLLVVLDKKDAPAESAPRRPSGKQPA
jgi:hypothetical protein